MGPQRSTNYSGNIRDKYSETNKRLYIEIEATQNINHNHNALDNSSFTFIDYVLDIICENGTYTDKDSKSFNAFLLISKVRHYFKILKMSQCTGI